MPLWRPLNWFCARINFLNKNGQFKTLREKDLYMAQFNFNGPRQTILTFTTITIPNLPLRGALGSWYANILWNRVGTNALRLKEKRVSSVCQNTYFFSYFTMGAFRGAPITLLGIPSCHCFLKDLPRFLQCLSSTIKFW